MLAIKETGPFSVSFHNNFFEFQNDLIFDEETSVFQDQVNYLGFQEMGLRKRVTLRQINISEIASDT